MADSSMRPPSTARSKGRMLRGLVIPLVFMTTGILLGAGYLLYMHEQGNFYAITAGEAYRSAVLDRDELEHYVRKHRIKSIVNLAGEHPGEAWYADELQVSAERKLLHYDLKLSASREPSPSDLQKLLAIFESVPRPVLIHCRAGADRSGLAAAMWKVVVDKEPKEEAKKQLSIWHGHIPIGSTSAMDRFFESWNPPAN